MSGDGGHGGDCGNHAGDFAASADGGGDPGTVQRLGTARPYGELAHGSIVEDQGKMIVLSAGSLPPTTLVPTRAGMTVSAGIGNCTPLQGGEAST